MEPSPEILPMTKRTHYSASPAAPSRGLAAGRRTLAAVRALGDIPGSAMTPPQIRRFLQECIIADMADGSAPSAEACYGLYVSWCALNWKVPLPKDAFRTALRLAGVCPETKGKKGVISPHRPPAAIGDGPAAAGRAAEGREQGWPASGAAAAMWP